MRDVVKAAKALSNETRIRILNLLRERECCVCEVMEVLDISQTKASRNLNILLNAGFLSLRHDGLWAYYSIDKRGPRKYISAFLKAVQLGVSGDNTTAKDVRRLKQSEPAGPQCCTKSR